MSKVLVGLPERIASKIEFGGDCWLWTAALNARGYGMANYEGRMQLAHRVVYGILVGAIPSRHHLHHRETCPHNCVTPEHLSPITIKDHAKLHPRNNMAWRLKMAQRTHCGKEHEMTPENTYVYRGLRKCRECRREANLRWLATA